MNYNNFTSTPVQVTRNVWTCNICGATPPYVSVTQSSATCSNCGTSDVILADGTDISTVGTAPASIPTTVTTSIPAAGGASA